MRMLTREEMARIRTSPLAPVTLARAKAATVRKLKNHRAEAIRDRLAALMRAAEPTAFALEAPARHAIRVSLIFEGWKWQDADAVAAAIVGAALALAGAKRPTWQQGQPEYTQDGYAPRERERCARCAKPLPEGNYRYCGPVCARAAKVDQNRRRDKEERYAKELIYRAAWTEKQPARQCPSCGVSFRPKRANSKYCSRECAHPTRQHNRRNVRMVCEAVRDE